jgi:hypothetical protein
LYLAIRKPGDLGEKDFVASTNHYNDASMTEYNLKDFEDEVLGFRVFPDTLGTPPFLRNLRHEPVPASSTWIL